MRSARRLLCLIVPLALSCGPVQDYSHVHTGCTGWLSEDWYAAMLTQVEHSDARSCPLGIQPGGQASSGGKVLDLTVPEWTIGAAQWLQVEPHSLITATSSHQCIQPIGFAQQAAFFLGQSQPPQGNRWQAEAWVSWPVQTSPEYVCFSVALANPFILPRAVITIPYNGSEF